MRSIRELQLQRPLEFNRDEERSAYISALNANLDATDTHTIGLLPYCDTKVAAT